MRDTLVLCYHALSETWEADLSVTPEAFSQQLHRLAGRGYAGVTFSEALTDGPGRRVAVTFDDAFASVDRLARPILDELGWPATVYAVADHAQLGTPLAWAGTDHWLRSDHAHELEGMGWDALARLVEAGWEVGSHTRTHPRLTELDDAALASELAESRLAVEHALGRPCPTIAYPYGDSDSRVHAAAEVAGYEAAAGLPADWPRPSRYDYPRVGVYYPDDLRRFRRKTSLVVRRLRRLAPGSSRGP